MKKRFGFINILFVAVFILAFFSLMDITWAVTPQIAAGQYHSIVIMPNGTLWAWGENFLGELGDGTTLNRSSPVQVGTDSDWESISAGTNHIVALKSNGTLWAWGYNYQGQLGDGTTANKTSPVQVGVDADWSAITAGSYYTIALKSNGTLWAWGFNDKGQLGDGTKGYQETPLMVFNLSSPHPSNPSNGQIFAACSYYNCPTFSWSLEKTYKNLEIQFSIDQDFSPIPVKVKAKGNITEILMKASTWKKILMMPEDNGGTIYWRVIGINSDKSTEKSVVRSIMIEPAQPVGSPTISSTSKSSFPTLSWQNHCNTKFKVWFGSDSSFAKKKVFSFSIKDPMADEGKFERHLTKGQWTAVSKLVGDVSGSTLYWYVESWDGIKRYSKSGTMSFELTE